MLSEVLSGLGVLLIVGCFIYMTRTARVGVYYCANIVGGVLLAQNNFLRASWSNLVLNVVFGGFAVGGLKRLAAQRALGTDDVVEPAGVSR